MPQPKINLTSSQRALALFLAAEARIDVRTAARALTRGVDDLGSLEMRERVERAMQVLGLTATGGT